MKVLLSDQGTNFESQRVKDLCSTYGIEKRRTSPYRPMCDGMVERFNRTLLNMLSMYVDANHNDWDQWLPQVVFAYPTNT
jgi:transposase InsO family protein